MKWPAIADGFEYEVSHGGKTIRGVAAWDEVIIESFPGVTDVEADFSGWIRAYNASGANTQMTLVESANNYPSYAFQRHPGTPQVQVLSSTSVRVTWDPETTVFDYVDDLDSDYYQQLNVLMAEPDTTLRHRQDFDGAAGEGTINGLTPGMTYSLAIDTTGVPTSPIQFTMPGGVPPAPPSSLTIRQRLAEVGNQ